MKYPVGFWNYSTVEDNPISRIDDWKDLSFSLPMSPIYDHTKDDKAKMLKILDEVHKQGMKMIVCDERCHFNTLIKNGEASYRQGFSDVLKDFGSHPAVFGFHVGDEPSKVQFEAACKAQAIHEEMSPSHYSFLNNHPWHFGPQHIQYNEPNGTGNSGEEFAKYLDEYATKSNAKFICYDCYSQMNPDDSGWNMYFYNINQYWQASKRHNIPFWTTLLSIPHFNYRCPNLDEFRWQINTAAAHGAKGILWFFIYQFYAGHSNYRNAPVNEHGRRTETFYNLADAQKSFCQQYGDILMELTLEKVQHHGMAYGNTPLFVYDDKVRWLHSHNNTPLIISYFKDKENHDYMMIVNNSCTDSTLMELRLYGNKKLSMVNHLGEVVEVVNAQDSPYIVRENDITKCTHWMCPGQAILFKYE